MEADKVSKTIIGDDIEITGSIKCSSQIQLDGRLVGDLFCNGVAVIGKSAVVKGNITVEAVSINGTVQGNITAKDRIEMKSTARVHGDIRAKRLTVEDGVTFIGKSEVNPSGVSAEGMPGGSPAPLPQSAAPQQDPQRRG